MKQIIMFGLVVIASATLTAGDDLSKRFRQDADRMLEWSKADRGCYSLIADFTDHYPRRISGSENL
jgi:hypothetical protein